MTRAAYLEVLERLAREYPSWKAPVVTFSASMDKDPFKILFSTILSLRTKDEVTEQACARLFARAKNSQDLAAMRAADLEKIIYPVGFYKVKAANIIEIAKTLNARHGGQIPQTLDELLAFKGVGRKTANLVLSLGFDKPAICVDIHVHRISNRLGFVQTKTPEQTEFALMKKLPKHVWNKINDLLVAFGQTLCRPVSPKCSVCPVATLCQRCGVGKSR